MLTGWARENFQMEMLLRWRNLDKSITIITLLCRNIAATKQTRFEFKRCSTMFIEIQILILAIHIVYSILLDVQRYCQFFI